eukprot:2113597-Pyramimonas_sp.AAC.1
MAEWRSARGKLRDEACNHLPFTAIVQRFEGITNSTYVVERNGSHLKRLTRSAGPLPRARAAMVGPHKRDARAGLQAILLRQQPQHQHRHPDRPLRREPAEVTPQKAYMMKLNEQLY